MVLQIGICNFLRGDIFERCHRLIVCDIEGWLVSFLRQFGEDLIKCFDDGFVLYICNWECKHIVGVVNICNKKILFAVEGHLWEFSRSICVECSLLFVCQCSITRKIVFLWFTIWDDDWSWYCGSIFCFIFRFTI